MFRGMTFFKRARTMSVAVAVLTGLTLAGCGGGTPTGQPTVDQVHPATDPTDTGTGTPPATKTGTPGASTGPTGSQTSQPVHPQSPPSTSVGMPSSPPLASPLPPLLDPPPYEAVQTCVQFVRKYHFVDYTKPFSGRDYSFIDLMAPGPERDSEIMLRNAATWENARGMDRREYEKEHARHSTQTTEIRGAKGVGTAHAQLVHLFYTVYLRPAAMSKPGYKITSSETTCTMVHQGGKWLISHVGQAMPQTPY